MLQRVEQTLDVAKLGRVDELAQAVAADEHLVRGNATGLSSEESDITAVSGLPQVLFRSHGITAVATDEHLVRGKEHSPFSSELGTEGKLQLNAKTCILYSRISPLSLSFCLVAFFSAGSASSILSPSCAASVASRCRC